MNDRCTYSLMDYVVGHPCWTLVYLCVVCFTLVAVAAALRGRS